MDKETKYALASIYETLKMLTAQVAQADATALALRMALAQADPELAKHFLAQYNGREVTEIKLQAVHAQVSLDAVIQGLRA